MSLTFWLHIYLSSRATYLNDTFLGWVPCGILALVWRLLSCLIFEREQGIVGITACCSCSEWDNLCVCTMHLHQTGTESPQRRQLHGIFKWHEDDVCMWVEYVKRGCQGQRSPCPFGHSLSLSFDSFHFSLPFVSLSLFPSCSHPCSVYSQAGIGLTMATLDWETATMIGGLFIYNHKGEVLISRVYRDDIGYVLQTQKLL